VVIKPLEGNEEQKPVPSMYTNASTTPFAATVAPGKNRFDFELTR